MGHEERHKHDGTTDSGGTLDGAHVDTYLDYSDAATPAAPDAHHVRAYVADDNGQHFIEIVDDGGVVSRIQRDVAVFVCKNTTGGSIDKGKAVYINGMASGIPTIALAKADSVTTMPCAGLTMSTVANNDFCKVLGIGRLANLDTSAFSAGDKLWVSPSTAGGFVTAEPSTLTQYIQYVGHVASSHASTGAILKEAGAFFRPVIKVVGLSTTANGSYTKTTANGVDQAEVSLMQLVIPAGTLTAGSILSLAVLGVISTNSNQPALDFRLRVGTNASFGSNGVATLLNTFTSNSTTNAGWDMTGKFRIKTIGATGTVRGQLAYFTEMNTQLTYGMELSNTTADLTIDTTQQLYVDLTADWSANGTGHVLVWDTADLELVLG